MYKLLFHDFFVVTFGWEVHEDFHENLHKDIFPIESGPRAVD